MPTFMFQILTQFHLGSVSVFLFPHYCFFSIATSVVTLITAHAFHLHLLLRFDLGGNALMG